MRIVKKVWVKFVENKDYSAAKTLCQNTNNPISRMIEKGIDRIDKPMTDISAAIENQGKLEIYKMENNLSNLATISIGITVTSERFNRQEVALHI